MKVSEDERNSGITPAYAGKRLKNPYNINLDFQIDPEVYSLHL